jgi:hypothetical protein
MNSHSVVFVATNALVCGSLAIVLVISWVWFIWGWAHAWRARAAMLDEERTRPAGLVQLHDLLGFLDRIPFLLLMAALNASARLARRIVQWERPVRPRDGRAAGRGLDRHLLN